MTAAVGGSEQDVDFTEHDHAETGELFSKHTHAWGSYPHQHILRAVCTEPECAEAEAHDIHFKPPRGRRVEDPPSRHHEPFPGFAVEDASRAVREHLDLDADTAEHAARVALDAVRYRDMHRRLHPTDEDVEATRVAVLDVLHHEACGCDVDVEECAGVTEALRVYALVVVDRLYRSGMLTGGGSA